MADEAEVYASEAEATRDRIADTIDELQDRLNPRNMVRDAVGTVSGAGEEFLTTAKSAVRDNPVVVGAAVLAVGLLALGGTKLRQARVELGDDLGGYSDYDDGYTPGAYSDGSDAYSGDGRSKLRTLSGRAGETLEANPLAGIVVGLAVGALLGALFPSTAAERRVLGQSSARLAAAARAAARTAKQQLNERGLSLDHAKAAAQSVASEVKAAANEVAHAAKHELKPAAGSSAVAI